MMEESPEINRYTEKILFSPKKKEHNKICDLEQWVGSDSAEPFPRKQIYDTKLRTNIFCRKM